MQDTLTILCLTSTDLPYASFVSFVAAKTTQHDTTKELSKCTIFFLRKMGDIQENYPECVAELYIFSHTFS